jgi:hypothetical protein
MDYFQHLLGKAIGRQQTAVIPKVVTCVLADRQSATINFSLERESPSTSFQVTGAFICLRSRPK